MGEPDRAVPAAGRDPWGWVSALAPLVLVLHAIPAPLGEPVAEDFDFLHHALYSGSHTLLDGGGSSAFWRPVAHQLYYGTLGRLALTWPGAVAAVHVLLLGAASWLLYRAFRRALPGPSAAFIATFPLLSESSRQLIAWPSHFVDLGVWLFMALALHETAARRLKSTLAALLLALGCKEVALVAALLLPWMPGIGPRGARERVRWAVAMALVAAAWAALYLVVRHRAALVLPHHREASFLSGEVPLLERTRWAVGNSLRALFSLPAAPVRGEWWIAAAALLVVAFAAVWWVRARDRAGLGRRLALLAWGGAWFAIATATVLPIYPLWSPSRSVSASLGFGAACVATVGAAGPAPLAALTALRVACFALSPGPPPTITTLAPATGAFLDFEHLVRLQRLMRETRQALEARYPSLPPGARVAQHDMPRLAEYAFGGNQSLRLWYRDTTLSWVSFADFERDPGLPVATVVEFQPASRPQIALVDAPAMREFFAARAPLAAADWDAALGCLARADSLQRDRHAGVFLGLTSGYRADALMGAGRLAEAEREARRGAALWNENVAQHYVLACLLYARGDLSAAASEADTVLSVAPDHAGARELRMRIREAAPPPAAR